MANKKHNSAGLLIPAFLLLGVGLGMVFGSAGAGVLIGLGVGFLAMFIAQNYAK